MLDADNVCPSVVPLFGTPILDMITSDLLTELRFCNEFLGLCARPKVETLEFSDFQERVLSTKPDKIKEDDFVNALYSEIYNDPRPRETIQVLHISDIHLDIEYTPGTNWDCDGYLCCRLENGFPTDPLKRAGQWGGYKCDLPVETFENMLEHVKKAHPDLQAVFWTGDNTAHDTWKNTAPEAIDYNKLVTAKIKDTFYGSVPVYPALGNHDTWPVNIQNF